MLVGGAMVMGWAKFDDRRHTNKKLNAACAINPLRGMAANGLDANGITYCTANETDGFVDDAAIVQLVPGANRRLRLELAALLVNVDRWTRDDDRGGWWIKNYLDFNPTRADLEKKRAEDVDRKRRQRRNQNGQFQTESERNPNGVQPDSTRSHTVPIPSHPHPIPSHPDLLNPSSDLQGVAPDTPTIDDLEIERLTRTWFHVLTDKGSNPPIDAVRESVREARRIADPRVVSERIGWIEQASHPRSAGYLVTTVRNYLRDHGQDVPA